MDLVVKDNLIGVFGSFFDYSDNFGLNSQILQLNNNEFITKHPDYMQLFEKILKSKINLVGIYILSTYYLNTFEIAGINIFPILTEIKRHKNDDCYLYGFLSVLEIANYFHLKNYRIEFLESSKLTKVPDLIVEFNGEKLTIDVKSRGYSQLCKIAEHFVFQIIHPEIKEESKSINDSALEELTKSKLLNQIIAGFDQADIVIIDETNNVTGIGGLFILKYLLPNEYKSSDTIVLKKDICILFSRLKNKFDFLTIPKEILIQLATKSIIN